MSIGLFGKKIGMTREFIEPGISIPVTVLLVEKGRIIDVITKEKRGYDAVRVGFQKIKTSKLTKQMKGVFAKKNTEPKRILKEFRVDNISEYKEGNEIGLELFKDQKFVDVTSKSDPENNLIFIKGSVPGSKNSIILIQKNSKNINRMTTLEKIKKVAAEMTKTEGKVKDKPAAKKDTQTKKVEKKEDKKK